MAMPNKEEIADFVRDIYRTESGRKKAVDKGQITMEELTIYHYINAWTNHNMHFIDDPIGRDDAHYATLQKAYGVATKVYSIDEVRAREIFEKVRMIPRID
ncbi:MAG: hypothetical protein KAI26_04280 [Nanoarchaeota archaeon]|nr:hypothetical protein [Nanoarchaeota archaeon]